MSDYEEGKRCCTVCDAKQLCHVCNSTTQYACSDCAIDFGVTVRVCPRCRREHEEKCSAQLRSQLAAAQRERDRLKEDLRILTKGRIIQS